MLRAMSLAAVVLLICAAAAQASVAIAVDPMSVAFQITGPGTGYISFDVEVTEIVGDANFAGIGIAAHLTGPGLSSLYYDADALSMRLTGPQWAAIVGDSFAWEQTSGSPAVEDFSDASVSALFGDLLGGTGVLTFGIASPTSNTTTLAVGDVVARFYIGWNGDPLSGPIYVGLSDDSIGVFTAPPVLFQEDPASPGTTGNAPWTQATVVDGNGEDPGVFTIPEPASMALVGVGLVMVFAQSRRRRGLSKALMLVLGLVTAVTMGSAAMAEDYYWVGVNTEANTDYTATDLDSGSLWALGSMTGATGTAPTAADNATINQNDARNSSDSINRDLVITASSSFAPNRLTVQRGDYNGPWTYFIFQKNMTLDKLTLNFHTNVTDRNVRVGTDSTDERRAFATGTVTLPGNGTVNIEGNLGNANFNLTTYTTVSALATAIQGAGLGLTATGAAAASGTLSIYSANPGSNQYLKITRNGTTFNVVRYVGNTAAGSVTDEDGQKITGLDLAPTKTLTLTGSDPLSILSTTDGFNVLWLADGSKLVFSNANVALNATSYGAIDGPTTSSVEFTAMGGAVSATRLGVNKPLLKVRSDQTWGTSYVVRLLDTNQVMVTSADGGTLNNLDNVAFYLGGQTQNWNFYIPSGEYRGLQYGHSATSGRTNTYFLNGNVALKGLAEGSADYSVIWASGQRISTILDLNDRNLTTAAGIWLGRTGGAYADTEYQNRRIDATNSVLTIGGDLVINANQNQAGYLSGAALAENRVTGVTGNASTVINLSGSYTTNLRSLSTSYAGLTQATVNLLGGTVALGTDGQETWEVTADPTTVTFGNGTSAIGTMNIGASGDEASIKLVNDSLNDNNELSTTKTKDGEVLLVGSLNIVNGKLDLNGLGVTLGSSTLSISTDGTLDLHTGEALSPGLPYTKFAGLGDQAAAWNAFKDRVVDSTAGNESLSFEAAYSPGDNKTYWVAKGSGPTGEIAANSLVTALPDTIRNNGTDTSTISIYLVDTGGFPVTDLTEADFSIDAGSAVVTFVGETDPGVSGIYTATVTSTTAAVETVSVTADGVALATEPTLTVVVPVPAKTPSTVASSRTEVPNTGLIPAVITVYIQDAFGSAMLGAASKLSLLEDGYNLGVVFTEIGSGQYTAAYTGEGSTAGARQIRVAYDLGGANQVILDDAADTKSITVFEPGTGVYPIADAGGDMTLAAEGCAATVELNGSSSDDDVGIAQYKWTYNNTGQTLYSGTDAVVTVTLGVGVHELRLTVTDDDTHNGVNTSDHSDAALATITVTAPADGSVQLDISSGFNMDTILGPKEMRTRLTYNATYDPDRDLKQIHGTEGFHNPAGPGIGWTTWENYSANLLVADSQTESYNLTSSSYILMNQGVREKGIIVGNDFTYHMASMEGNATLPGDWIEVANPTAPNHAPLEDPMNPGTYLAFGAAELIEGKANTLELMSVHDNSFQITDVTATLPPAQQQTYQSVNFLLTGFSTYPGRNMQIRAVYEDDSEETLWAFDYLVTPKSTTADASVDPNFHIVCSVVGYATTTSVSAGPSTRRLFEFTAARPLSEPGLKLKAIRVVDTSPNTKYQARGVAVFAASAIASPTPLGVADADESSVVMTPSLIPNDNVTPATITVTLRDANRMRVTGLAAGDFAVLVSGAGTNTVGNFQELGSGVYTFDLTSDTAGVKDVSVTADGVAITQTGSVSVYSAPVADAGADQSLDATSSYMLVTLDGSGSYDAEGSIVGYKWTLADNTVLYNGASAVVQVPLAPGSYAITLTVTNDAAAPGPYTDTDDLEVTIAEKSYVTEAIALDAGAANVDAIATAAEVSAASAWYSYWIGVDTDVVQNGKTFGAWVDTPPVDSWTVGVDGAWGVATVDDDSNGTVDDASEAGWPGSDDVAVNSDPSDDVWVPDTASNHLDGSVRWAFSAASDVMTGLPGELNTDEWYEYNNSRWHQPTVALNHLPDPIRGEAGDFGSLQPTVLSGYAAYVLQPFDVGQAALDAATTAAELPASKNVIKMGTNRGASTPLEASLAERTVMLASPKRYSNVNVLMSGTSSSTTYKYAWVRVVALYQTYEGVAEETVFESPYRVHPSLPYGPDPATRGNWIAWGVPSTTFSAALPVVTGTDGDWDFDDDGNTDLNPVVVGWKYYSTDGNGNSSPFYNTARSLAAGSYYRYWELDSDGVPVNPNRPLVGLRFEVDNGPNYWATGYPEGNTLRVFAVAGTPAPEGTLTVTAAVDQSFVYQNAAQSTGDAHQATVTASVVADTFGNSSYTMAVYQSGSGAVRVFDGSSDMAKVIKGSLRTDGVTGTGTCNLHVEVAGDVMGIGATDTSIEVRRLGDVDGNGAVTTGDVVELQKCLNGLVAPARQHDLDGSGAPSTADLVLLYRVINNLNIQ